MWQMGLFAWKRYRQRGSLSVVICAMSQQMKLTERKLKWVKLIETRSNPKAKVLIFDASSKSLWSDGANKQTCLDEMNKWIDKYMFKDFITFLFVCSVTANSSFWIINKTGSQTQFDLSNNNKGTETLRVDAIANIYGPAWKQIMQYCICFPSTQYLF